MILYRQEERKVIEMIEIKQGIKFKGNINNCVMQVIKIENGKSPMVWIKDLKTNKIFGCGLEMLKRCQITILE